MVRWSVFNKKMNPYFSLMKRIRNFFDYVYYKCCQFYDRNGEGSGAGISGLALLSVFQILNLISIMAAIFQIFHYYININKFWFAVPFLALLILNGIRYNKLNYGVLSERWRSEDAIKMNKNETGVTIYMVSTVIIVIAVIIWRAITR
jgi:hypothetical protein